MEWEVKLAIFVVLAAMSWISFRVGVRRGKGACATTEAELAHRDWELGFRHGRRAAAAEAARWMDEKDDGPCRASSTTAARLCWHLSAWAKGRVP